MVKVTVIVPMYNVQEYVSQCLESLAAQTLRDMEVILVDDGCTDSTPEIALKFSDQYPDRFRLLHKTNGGLSDARNYGIPYAKGKYIAFLDSDDYVEPSLYEKMSDLMEQGNDAVVTDIEYSWKDTSRNYVMKGLSDWSAETIQKKAMLSPMFAWNKMYKASFFTEDGYRYPIGTWYEDTPVTARIFAHCHSIGYLNECLIHYRQREGSIMASCDDPRIRDIFHVMELVREEFETDGLEKQYHDELEYLHIEHLCLYGMFRFIRSPFWKECYQTSRAVMMTCYPQWHSNSYLKNLSRKNQYFLRFYSRGTAWLFHRLICKGD
ncbi:MAG: glycosyltransferase family 2 protein [Erysipelotrichia bacterium]|nr:glycosyltransferase family 2 protein [Erysipelotrichia bacterium]